ncbi:MAG: YccF domain-containing protein [Flavobacteriales bacterium]
MHFPYLLCGILLYISLIYIPRGWQYLNIAQLALSPFGKIL